MSMGCKYRGLKKWKEMPSNIQTSLISRLLIKSYPNCMISKKCLVFGCESISALVRKLKQNIN